jgi:hypothetical protein
MSSGDNVSTLKFMKQDPKIDKTRQFIVISNGDKVSLKSFNVPKNLKPSPLTKRR